MQCEGWRRTGGAFTLGPVTWNQCKNDAIANIKFKQGKESIKTLPGCKDCWQECVDEKNIKILSVEPIRMDRERGEI